MDVCVVAVYKTWIVRIDNEDFSRHQSRVIKKIWILENTSTSVHNMQTQN